MKNYLSLLLLCLSFGLMAQSPRFDAHLHFGLSDITYDYDLDVGTAFTDRGFSVNAGFGLEFDIGSSSAAGIRMTYTRINGQEGGAGQQLFGINPNTGEEELVGLLTYERNIRFNYLAFPVYLKQKFGSLGVQAGWQTMLYLGGNSVISGQVETAMDVQIIDDAKTRADGTDTFDFGPHIELNYDIDNILRLHLNAFIGIKDNTPDEATNLESKNRQYTLGVSFRL